MAAAKQKLLATQNITSVHDLMKLTDEREIKTGFKTLPGIGVKSLNKWILESNTALPGAAVPPSDHTKASNPYEISYGKNWMEPLAKSTSIAICCSINELIDHIFQETAAIFVGSTYENYWLVYYDAPSLLISKKSTYYKQ